MEREKLDKRLYEGRYMRSDGMICPICLSDKLESKEHVEVNYDSAFQEVECLNCHATWEDVYRLIGIQNLEAPEVK